tara:strand:- start:719 stop:1039 length:321 start_codon:yes stop_codon:yes gene_type:complete
MAVKKIKEVADPVEEAKNLLLEIEQVEEDIATEREAEMVRAVAENKAIMAKNAKAASNKKYMDIHMAKKLVSLSSQLVGRCTNGGINGRFKQLLDLMYKYEKEDNK